VRDLEVVIDGLARLLGQLKSNWSPGLSLTHRRSINCVPIGSKVIDPDGDDVAAPQFTADGKIEHRQVTRTPLNLEHGANCPDVLLAGAVAPINLPLFQGVRLGGDMARFASSCMVVPLLLTRGACVL
jgi:hypothetical protein